ERQTERGLVYTGKVKQRLCLVLDCLCAHDFSSRNADLLNLQHYVIRQKKLSEKESIVIFYDTVRVVESLHKKNIVHRDLKLGNLVLNRCTHRVTITNFCLGKHLGSENDRLKDQRGSPAYISPDVLCGKPYLGKPSDMWALGVVLFTMLYGQFPFYDSSPTQLFNKIRAADYSIPSDGRVSGDTITLIRCLLVLEPKRRMTASEVLDFLSVIIANSKLGTYADELLQVVPDIDDSEEDKSEVKQCLQEEAGADRLDGLFQNTRQQEQNESQQYVGPSMMAAQCNRRVGHIPIQRIGQDAREVTRDELNQYQHLLHPVWTGKPLSVVSQPTRSLSHHSSVPQSLGGLPCGDTERIHSVTDTGNTSRVALPVASSSVNSQHPVHSYQAQPSQGLLNRHPVNVDRCVPVSHCPSNNTTAQCILNDSCLTQEVQNLTASQMQDNGDVGHNHPSSSVFQHRNACVPDGLDHQKQLHGSEALGSSNSRAEGVRNIMQGGHAGSGSQVEPVITSVILSHKDACVRQRQLSSFISSLGLTSAVTNPAVPCIRRETQSHSPQHTAALSLDCVRNSTSTRQGVSLSAQPSRYARDGRNSSVLQGLSQIRQSILRQCSISPQIRRNIVENLTLLLRARREANNRRITDDGSNGRRTN
ncbi:Serine/threonine-protein kinase 40, partial [Cryptotermes secundus]